MTRKEFHRLTACDGDRDWLAGHIMKMGLRQYLKWRWEEFSSSKQDQNKEERHRVRRILTPMTKAEVMAFAQWMPSEDGDWITHYTKFLFNKQP